MELSLKGFADQSPDTERHTPTYPIMRWGILHI
jgi:hypothetical protein